MHSIHKAAHKAALASALLAVSGFALTPASAQNLVTNPGFETGDFTGWTASGQIGIFSPGYTGNYAVALADNGSSSGSLSQTLATVAGHSYDVSLFLDGNFNPNFSVNAFTASFAGFQGVNATFQRVEASNTSFTQYNFTATATGPISVLQLEGSSAGFFNGAGAVPLYLDDISVTDASPVPEASSVISLGVLLALGLVGMAWSARRRNAKTAG